MDIKKHILSVPWRDLSRENVPYGSPFLNGFGMHLNSSGYPFKKKFVICSNDLGYLFGKNCHPFERLGLCVWKKLSSVALVGEEPPRGSTTDKIVIIMFSFHIFISVTNWCTDDSWHVLINLTSTPEHANTHATNSNAISFLTPGPGSSKDD